MTDNSYVDKTRGICGEQAPGLLLVSGDRLWGPVCDLQAEHSGLHRALQIETPPIHWGYTDEKTYDEAPAPEVGHVSSDTLALIGAATSLPATMLREVEFDTGPDDGLVYVCGRPAGECDQARADLAAALGVVKAAEAIDEVTDYLLGLVVDAQHEHRDVQRRHDFYTAIAEQIKRFEAAVDVYRTKNGERNEDAAGAEPSEAELSDEVPKHPHVP